MKARLGDRSFGAPGSNVLLDSFGSHFARFTSDKYALAMPCDSSGILFHALSDRLIVKLRSNRPSTTLLRYYTFSSETGRTHLAAILQPVQIDLRPTRTVRSRDYSRKMTNLDTVISSPYPETVQDVDSRHAPGEHWDLLRSCWVHLTSCHSGSNFVGPRSTS